MLMNELINVSLIAFHQIMAFTEFLALKITFYAKKMELENAHGYIFVS